jgi:DNA-binding Xre family transcriptional regulator
MTQTLIKWRLREVMARYRIKAVDLAEEIGVSPNSVSNLRNSESMPRLDGSSLNNLCNALNKLAINLEEEITPITLIDYSRDSEPEPTINLEEQIERESTKLKNKKHPLKSDDPKFRNFQLIFISKPRSA